MSDGSTSTTGFDWSVEGGGAVSVSGLYTAPSASQETPATITATKGGKTGTAIVQSIYKPATIEAKANITGKVGGSTTAFSTMFTATDSSAGDYSFVVTPSSAGTVSASGVLTLSNNATGTVTVKATHKTQSGVEATVTFTGVVAKAGITGKSVTGKIGGDTVAFDDLFTVTNSTASNYSFVSSPSGMTTSINTNTGLVTLSANATGDVIITATHKTQTGVTATGTISSVTPKATITAKTVEAKVGGDIVSFAEMFTSNNAATAFNYVVTPTAAGTVDSSGSLTLADDPGAETVTVKATHKSQIIVTATCSIPATPKVV
ncbi:bacterial Ig-like domain protein [Shigella phage SGF2]|uniref:Bacterial Ig-like domain protein n=1 Tax=Shigella phage SGF2 TaxID=2601630 RepID=A0A5C1K9C0_9CAUD|nr:Ig domain containing protein [Shigella phage SGF2]QEM42582.1 bacterial Ig-like domain protein [Shigella phage SGF2]